MKNITATIGTEKDIFPKANGAGKRFEVRAADIAFPVFAIQLSKEDREQVGLFFENEAAGVFDRPRAVVIVEIGVTVAAYPPDLKGITIALPVVGDSRADGIANFALSGGNKSTVVFSLLDTTHSKGLSSFVEKLFVGVIFGWVDAFPIGHSSPSTS